MNASHRRIFASKVEDLHDHASSDRVTNEMNSGSNAKPLPIVVVIEYTQHAKNIESAILSLNIPRFGYRLAL